jgi:tetratricopeptide (TPR) repeat protein
MSTAVWTIPGVNLESAAEKALKAAARFWFGVTVIGQLIFAFAVASFFGMAALRGNSAIAWSKHFTHGYIPGDTPGNLAIALHLISAVVINLAGMLQLVPQVRERFPVFHRWNGRLYVVTAFTISLAGLYMVWVRGSVGDLTQHLGSTLMAVLIMVCAVMALRYAMVRDFSTHRRWALRLYLVISASLFIRAAFFLSIVLNHGPFGFDPVTFTGPFINFVTFSQYLVPLAVLELYLRAKQSPGMLRRFATAALLLVLTVGLGVGIFAVTMVIWLPQVKTGFDSRTSIASVLLETIKTSGVDQAVQQYRDLKAADPATYNFGEAELNVLGYQLIKQKRFKEAIRIFQLNAEAYPHSSNAYDSLAEGYMDDGDKALAVTNYKKALEFDPKNRNSALMLQKLAQN